MSEKRIRVAIVGVGNCASALVQGIDYYRGWSRQGLPGVMHDVIGGYSIGDIEFSAAFDIADNKVGRSLGAAIWQEPNCTLNLSGAPPSTDGPIVHRGMTHDGVGKYLADVVHKSPHFTDDVAVILQETKTDVLVNYLPVGSEEATKWYMEQALAAQVAVVNCIPVFIASSPYWSKRFVDAKLPIVGDDVKSQVGATIVHRVLAQLFKDRGVHLDRTMQLNVGGNTDFLNMLERERLESKKISKTQAVTSLTGPMKAENVHIGPSDYVPWLTDRKWAYITLEGTAFGGAPLKIDLKLEVWDSPNSAGVVVDAIRCAKMALDHGQGGPLVEPSSYFMKSPPRQFPDDVARRELDHWIDKYTVKR